MLITDGFIEWANADGEEFGAGRLMEVVRACREMPSAGIISELYSEVIKFAGPAPQRDDLTGPGRQAGDPQRRNQNVTVKTIKSAPKKNKASSDPAA